LKRVFFKWSWLYTNTALNYILIMLLNQPYFELTLLSRLKGGGLIVLILSSCG